MGCASSTPKTASMRRSSSRRSRRTSVSSKVSDSEICFREAFNLACNAQGSFGCFHVLSKTEYDFFRKLVNVNIEKYDTPTRSFINSNLDFSTFITQLSSLGFKYIKPKPSSDMQEVLKALYMIQEYVENFTHENDAVKTTTAMAEEILDTTDIDSTHQKLLEGLKVVLDSSFIADKNNVIWASLSELRNCLAGIASKKLTLDKDGVSLLVGCFVDVEQKFSSNKSPFLKESYSASKHFKTLQKDEKEETDAYQLLVDVFNKESVNLEEHTTYQHIDGSAIFRVKMRDTLLSLNMLKWNGMTYEISGLDTLTIILNQKCQGDLFSGSSVDTIKLMHHITPFMQILHRNKITHLDLKPDNIMVCESNKGIRYKVSDYGSIKQNRRAGEPFTITPPYTHPSLLLTLLDKSSFTENNIVEVINQVQGHELSTKFLHKTNIWNLYQTYEKAAIQGSSMNDSIYMKSDDYAIAVILCSFGKCVSPYVTKLFGTMPYFLERRTRRASRPPSAMSPSPERLGGRIVYLGGANGRKKYIRHKGQFIEYKQAKKILKL